jgi:GT2 family glycosyltransferase
MISVLIATKNRSGSLFRCLRSISTNSVKTEIEIIVVDQSLEGRVPKIPKVMNNTVIKTTVTPKYGKAYGLNEGLKIATGDIIVFIDDDCIVSSDWLQHVNNSFNKTDVSGAFGKTLPYQPALNRDKHCPSTFSPAGGYRLITKPVFHADKIGFGNNMAFRKSVLTEIGNFRWWLGPGSIGSNAEDADISLRALIDGHKLLYNPKMIVYHDRWLTEKEDRVNNRSYICGESACYGFFALTGHDFAKKIVGKSILSLKSDFRSSLSNLASGRLGESRYHLLNGFYRLRGLAVACLMSLLYRNNPLSKRS